MITHDLVQKGFGFEESYAVADAIRDRVADLETVTTQELRELIQDHLEEHLGADRALLFARPRPAAADRYVIHRGQKQPLSRGLLANSIHAAGVELDRAYLRVAELEQRLVREEVTTLTSQELARRVAEVLEEVEGADAARRYRLVRRIQRLPRPVVIYIGGASGTGKSTLALELAPLLRIYRITATDTIRQMMRIVFSPQILPELHSSSFETGRFGPEPDVEALPWGAEAEQRVVTRFEEQASRVIVGVRAVVERAIEENMSIVVEGVHLHPPSVPFSDLEGACYQVPLVLALQDRETHRTRFLSRARLGGRRADRYVDNFTRIRAIHDHLLQQAEAHNVPLLDADAGDRTVANTVRLVTGVLERRLPTLARSGGEEEQTLPPTLLLVIDGLADRPVRALGGRTPLAAADLPTLDRLAREGRCGLADPVAPGVVPDTAAGCLALFGQSPLALKRGPVEALGAGLELQDGDVALRANWATLDDSLRVIDRRAGRIRDNVQELAAAIDRLPLPGSLAEEVEIRVAPGTEHRLAIRLRGEGLSANISGSDPGEGAGQGPSLVPGPNDPEDSASVYTARILGLFEQQARQVLEKHEINRRRQEQGHLPANAILTRGAGRIHRLLALEQGGTPLSITCISGDRTVLGLARWLGATVVTSKKMTANLDTDLGSKFEAVRGALEHEDLVVLHVKGADIAAHDQRPDLKVAFLESLDEALGEFLASWDRPLRIAVAADHATLSESGQHSADPLPVLIWGTNIEADSVQMYDESAVSPGKLQRFPLQMLLGRLFPLS